MDSLTQIVLGGAVGEAILGKKAGNKAVLWGATAGTIPDLDVLFRFTHSYVDSLDLHRGFSHSFFFSILFAPILGWIIYRIHKRSNIALFDWIKLAFFGLVTHPILDNFTTWGTEFFWPFSSYRIAWKTVFVIDPLYTVPFLFLLVWAMFKPKESRRRRRLNYAGLAWSTFYLLVGVINHQQASSTFDDQLSASGLEFERKMVGPTPLNTILWKTHAETTDGYYLGYYSLLDENERMIPFAFLKHNHDLLEPWHDHEDLQALLKFTEGYYHVEKVTDGFIISDMRFGQLTTIEDASAPFVVRHHVTVNDDQSLTIYQEPRSTDGMGKAVDDLWERLKGLPATAAQP